MLNETEIKIHLVEFLLRSNNYEALISEFSYMHGNRRADIATFCETEAIAYEIKSARDNISRLKEQLQNYKLYFDQCYIVCEQTNIKNIREICEKSYGLIVVSNGDMKVVRKARTFKRLDKASLLSSLSYGDLQKLVGNRSIQSKHDMCEFLAGKLPLTEIKRASRASIINKFRPSLRQLSLDTLEKLTSDDLLTISKSPSVKLS